jgi:membrane-bound metal-dependent hydrolase YbcI (DUF457 family)
MAAKRVAPSTSLGTLELAAQLADGVWPVFLLLGLEQVVIAPGITRVTPLDFVHYPYSHSLVADCGWATLLALGYGLVTRKWRAAAWLAALVLSHWLLDAASHRPDVPVWPGGPKVGMGLWNSLPATLLAEALLFTAGAWVYARTTRSRDRLGNVLLAAYLAVLALLYLAAVFGPSPPDVRVLAITSLAGWLLVAWAYWIDRHRVLAIAV